MFLLLVILPKRVCIRRNFSYTNSLFILFFTTFILLSFSLSVDSGSNSDENAVVLTVVYDKDEPECDPTQVIEMNKRLIPDLVVKKLHYTEPEAKQILELSRQKKLNVLVFSSSINQTDIFPHLKNSLGKRGSFYFLRQGKVCKEVKINFTLNKPFISYLERNGYGYLFDERGSFPSSVFSPRGNMLAVTSGDNITIFDTNTWFVLRKIVADGDKIKSITFSPDGKFFALGGKNRVVYVFETFSWEQLKSLELLNALEKLNEQILDIDFSPDGKQLAVITYRRVTVFDTLKWTQIKTFENNLKQFSSADYSPDGAYFAAASRKGTILMWDTHRWNPIRELKGHFEIVSQIGFSPDGKYLASLSYDKTTKIWETQQWKEIKTFNTEYPSNNQILFSPNGEYLITGVGKNYKCWNIGDWSLVGNLDNYNGHFAFSISPNGKYFVARQNRNKWVVSYFNKTVDLGFVIFSKNGYNLENFQRWNDYIDNYNEKRNRLNSLHSTKPTEEMISSFLSTNDFGKQHGLIATFKANNNVFNRLVFSPDNRYLASSDQKDGINVWDLKTWSLLYNNDEIVIPGKPIFSPDSKSLIIGVSRLSLFKENFTPSQLVFMDIETLNIDKKRYVPFKQYVASMLLTPVNNDILIKRTYWDSFNYYDWSGISSSKYYVLGYGYNIAFDPKGKYIALPAKSSSRDYWGAKIKILDANTLNKIISFDGHNAFVTAIDFSDDGRYLASASTFTVYSDSKKSMVDMTHINIWSVPDFKLVSLKRDEYDFIYKLRFIKNGNYLVTGSADGIMRIWDVSNGGLKSCWPANLLHNNPVGLKTFEISQNGKYLATAASSGNFGINIWDLDKFLETVDRKSLCKNYRKIKYPSARPNGVSCRVDPDCKSFNCFKRTCKPSGYKGEICVNDSDCSPNQYCTKFQYCKDGKRVRNSNQNPVNEKTSNKTLQWGLLIGFVFIVLLIGYKLYKIIYGEQKNEIEYTGATSEASKDIIVRRGFDRAGQYLKIGVKVENKGNNVITKVQVNLNVPTGLKFVGKQTSIVDLGVIESKTSRSANFKLRPFGRCVEGNASGVVLFRDFSGVQHSIDIKPLSISSICPMLEQGDASKEEFMDMMASKQLKSNKVHISFEGSTSKAFQVAKNRVKSLKIIEEDSEEDEEFMVFYACFYGKTKYKNIRFVVEILGVGTYEQGELTVIAYADDASILTGFFSEMADDIKKIIKITGESAVSEALICSGCGAPIDLSNVEEHGYHACTHCETLSYIAMWNRQ